MNKLQQALEEGKENATKAVMSKWNGLYNTGLYSKHGADQKVAEYFSVCCRTVRKMRLGNWKPYRLGI